MLALLSFIIKLMYIIFANVDNTIIDHKLNLLPKTIEDIKYAQNKGVIFAINTGNSHFENMQKLSKKLNADFLITSNGSRIFDFKNNKLIMKNIIKKKQTQNIFNQIKKYASYLTLSTEKEYQIFVKNENYKAHAINSVRKYNCNDDSFVFVNEIINDVYDIGCRSTKEQNDKIAKIAKKNGFNVIRANETFLWINQNNNKGNSAKYLCELININKNNVMAIGDSYNDIEMLKITKNSYAMDNSNIKIKKIANHYTSSVEQNGLGEAIIDFLFRNKID